MRPALMLSLALPLAFAAAPACADERSAPPADVPEKIELPPSPESAPTVTIRKVDNGDVVEEYRTDGRITMIRVRPLRGPAWEVHDANGDGRLDRKDVEGPVAPVYWTLYQWD
jgi:hypothetical protein